jgi:hypothetical protein
MGGPEEVSSLFSGYHLRAYLLKAGNQYASAADLHKHAWHLQARAVICTDLEAEPPVWNLGLGVAQTSAKAERRDARKRLRISPCCRIVGERIKN